ncbi:hypothetical protein GZH47_18080 [Paenibacillus rhizovicinus]|uniref:Uncharacterized protein n=1 Tax=Paenibacillus rhizovicinus TaxID=2704463 RepID=A0A6C0P1V8_9BACL|nr:hypothetical protein [Paenibacillus rhizovicinus]QHW32530.1 hypothetical protein GZH47_18080 [Paenibacillus rhizovicinus]
MFFFMAMIVIITFFVLSNLMKSRNGSPSQRGGRGGPRISRPAALLPAPPECLGVPAGHPVRPAAERLEEALTPDFEARVKDRVLRLAPSMREGEWQWRWFELKRYFLLCGVLRGVPMYSAQVDDVWHEMLMFTREYEQFCRQFCGSLIHHAPHTADAQPDRGARAWFDWVYGELFLPVFGSARLWGSFYRTPMPRELMHELATGSAEELRGRRFNTGAAALFPDLAATVDYLIERGRSLASSRSAPQTDNDGDLSSTMLMTGIMSGAFFYSSWGPEENFQSQMDAYQPEEEPRENNNNSGCSGTYACSGDNGTDGNGGDGSSCSGSDGGGDSGSSCGGGSSCGSSCGGGGGD